MAEPNIIGERSPLMAPQQGWPPSPRISSPGSRAHDNSEDPQKRVIRRAVLWRLYVSHFLSTWNMRSYEFTVILLFAAAYPDTLLPTSIRGILTNGATLVLSPAVGKWVDRNASRFHTIRTTIVLQRVSIVLACLLWMMVFWSMAPGILGEERGGGLVARAPQLPSRDVLVAVIIGLSMVERVCAVGNQFVMERDWIPTLASETSQPPLHTLNAIMRRIDLISKILAPVFVSVIKVRTNAVALAAVTAGLNLGTVWLELITARMAWNRCGVLEKERTEAKDSTSDALLGGSGELEEEDALPPAPVKKGLALYFSSDACLASISMALQSFSVLSLSGPMTTYLLTRHYSLSLITTARTAISTIEISSTLSFPPLAALLTAHPPPLLPDPMAALGLGGVSLQLLLLVPCFAALVLVPTSAPDPAAAFPGLTVLIFVFLGLSRLGHWTHNMAVQQIAQTRVPARHRVEFSGVETTLVSAAEIGRWACSAVWSQPRDFKGVAAAGMASVVVCWGLFAAWVWQMRRKGVFGRVERERERAE